MKKQNTKTHFNRRSILLLTVLALGLYILLPQLGQFHSSFQALKQADVGLLALAFCSILGAGITAALTYKQLIFKPIAFPKIVLVQYSGMFINRLLPAGIGGVSLFIDFLYRQGHTLAQASTVAAVNNGMGSIAHLSLLFFAACATGFSAAPSMSVTISEFVLYLGIGLSFIVFFLLFFVFHTVRSKGRLTTFIKNVGRTISKFRTRKLALLRAYVCSILNTSLHVLALTLVLRAFDIDLSIITSLIVLTGGVAAATVTPTPGGVVGAEAAITATLIAYDVHSGTALAAALSYRFVSYWLPILPGVIAFLYIQKRRYI